MQRTGKATGFDPIKFEVVRNAFVFATEEMAATLRRSAYSTNVKTRADFSCGLFDRELRTIAQDARPLVWVGGEWRPAGDADAVDASMMTGESNVGGFLRLTLNPARTPAGP